MMKIPFEDQKAEQINAEIFETIYHGAMEESIALAKVEGHYESFKGTLEYIPYEYMINGSYKPWDHIVWSFGIMLHFFTLMKYPFLKEEEITEYNLDKNKINKLPPTFSNLIYDCLQKDPLKRPENLLERLENLKVS